MLTAYPVIDGRVKATIVGMWGQVGYWDLGPARPPSRKERAWFAMQKMEHRGQTDRPLYDLARRIALHEMGLLAG